MATVSVIIPTYNHRDFVVSAIQSVFAQSFTDHEIIVVDDGSPDDTAQLLEPLASAGQIRLIRQANQGQAAARNRGVAESSGELIAFLDDDDLWLADKLAWQVTALRTQDWIAVGGSCQYLSDQPSPPLPGNARVRLLSLAELFKGSPFHSPGQLVVRRTALQAVGGFDPDIWGVDDLDLYMRLAGLGKFAAVDRPSLLYRRHPGNASLATDRMFTNGLRVLRKNLALLPPEHCSRARSDGFRWLYNYVGGQAVRSRLASKNPLRWLAILKIWARLAIPALNDPALMRAMLWEVVPPRIRNHVIRNAAA